MRPLPMTTSPANSVRDVPAVAVPAIDVRGVSLTYPGHPPVPALDQVAMRVPQGAFVSIIGPSGCGKSTLLRAIAGLIPPTDGTITIEGTPVHGPGAHVAFMPQRDLLLPWRRAMGNAILGATLAGTPRPEAERLARTLFPRFGLTGFERAWPAQLSGGMRQRLALLRTFLVPRPVLLLDEPFGALDALTRLAMQDWLQEVWMADGRAVLLVTHDVEEALQVSDMIYVFSNGRSIASASVALALRPRSRCISPGRAAVPIAPVMSSWRSRAECWRH